MAEISNPFVLIENRLSNIETILESLKRESSRSSISTEGAEDIGAISLAEKITGLAKPTIYALVSQSKIPHMKQGKRLYFSRVELTGWIRAGKRKTILEKQNNVATLLLNSKKKAKHSTSS